MAARRKIDWEAIEIEFRAGIKTLRQIGDEFGISHVAVAKRAKRDNWPRDLTAKIAARTQEKVNRALVTSSVTKTAEKQVVELNAEMLAAKHIEHRKDIPEKRALVGKLFAEIEGLTDGPELMAQLQEALEQGGLDGLAKVAERVASLPSRIKGTSELVGAYKSLIGLERQAFRMDNEDPSTGDLYTDLHRARARIAGRYAE